MLSKHSFPERPFELADAVVSGETEEPIAPKVSIVSIVFSRIDIDLWEFKSFFPGRWGGQGMSGCRFVGPIQGGRGTSTSRNGFKTGAYLTRYEKSRKGFRRTRT